MRETLGSYNVLDLYHIHVYIYVTSEQVTRTYRVSLILSASHLGTVRAKTTRRPSHHHSPIKIVLSDQPHNSFLRNKHKQSSHLGIIVILLPRSPHSFLVLRRLLRNR